MCEQCVAKVHTLSHHGYYITSLAIHSMLAFEDNSEETDDLIKDAIDFQRKSMEKIVKVLESQLKDMDADETVRAEWYPTQRQRHILKAMLSEFCGLRLLDMSDWEQAREAANLKSQISELLEQMDVETTTPGEMLGGYDPDVKH